MPVALREHQHEIMSRDGVQSLVFGTEDTGYLTLTRPVVVGAEFTTADTTRPGADGRMFGRDYIGGKAVTFEVGVLTDMVPEAATVGAHRANLDYLNDLEAFWLDEQWRDDPWSWTVLRSHEAGQTWRCYGRPSRYEEAAGTLTAQGYTPVGLEFRLIDHRWYADVESRVDVPSVAAPTGGFVTPFTFPLTSTTFATTVSEVTVGGRIKTPLMVEFHGPISDPVLRIGQTSPLLVGLDGTIGENETVTVDARPWAMDVTRASDGASLGGWLNRRTPMLPDVALKPGTYTVSLTGASPTGTAWARVRWRDARTRP